MESELLSLYDYLEKPAGPKLGDEVFKASKALNIKPKSKEVETKTYCGNVMIYPKDFLEVYFKHNPQV